MIPPNAMYVEGAEISSKYTIKVALYAMYVKGVERIYTHIFAHNFLNI